MSPPELSASRDAIAAEDAADQGDRLLRIALARWAAVALTIWLAFAQRPRAIGAPWSVLGIAAALAVVNTLVTVHDPLPGSVRARVAPVTMLGDLIWVSALVALSTNQAVEVRGTLAAAVFAGGVAAVISERRRRLAVHATTLARQARTDHLTGTGNRLAFEEAAVRLGHRRYALVAVDVDGMRQTNTACGYAAGDEHLVSVARVLDDVCEGDDLAARIGGDLFVLLLPDGDSYVAADRAERVRAAMHGVQVSRGSVRVSVACVSGDPGMRPTTSLALAEDALFAARGGGGDRVVAAGQPAGAPRGWQLRRQRTVVEAMVADDAFVHSVYHRVVRIDDRATVGWEGLARPFDWPPDAHVEALFTTARRMGAERDLDWRCRRSALAGAATLDGLLFVNINVTGLVDPLLGVDQMQLVCEWARRPPGGVILELGERDLVADLPRLRQAMTEHRAAGFRFALDGMGEGHTTLELVVAARPEFLKIAGPLIRAAGTDPTSYAAAKAVVGFAHHIGSLVVAEGVEDEAVLATCIELGIDLGQGWLFGRPLQIPTTR